VGEIKTYWKMVAMIVIWMVLVACMDIRIQFKEDEDMMTIDKAELSEETTDILKVLDHQAYFFDSKVDDTIEKISNRIEKIVCKGEVKHE